jgi:hypothetical protein
MYNINFLPHWYKEKRLNRLKQIMWALITGFIFLDIIISMVLLKNYKSISVENKMIEDLVISSKVQRPNLEILRSQKTSALNFYWEISQYINNDTEIATFDIGEKEVVIEAKVKDKNNYINLIKSIEKDKCFKINHLSEIAVKENEIHFRFVIVRN